MWHIVSKNGLRGIETYYSESDAWNAADIRNELANQGWHPVRAAYAALFFVCAPAVVARSIWHSSGCLKKFFQFFRINLLTNDSQ